MGRLLCGRVDCRGHAPTPTFRCQLRARGRVPFTAPAGATTHGTGKDARIRVGLLAVLALAAALPRDGRTAGRRPRVKRPRRRAYAGYRGLPSPRSGPGRGRAV